MPLLLENSSSTSPSNAVYLAQHGDYKLSVSIPSGDAATVAVEERMVGTTAWMPVADLAGNALVLSRTAPSAVIAVRAGQELRVTRSGGSAAISVAVDFIH